MCLRSEGKGCNNNFEVLDADGKTFWNVMSPSENNTCF